MIQLDLFDGQVVPIPDCTDLIEFFGKRSGFNSPLKVADEMLREARMWQDSHPKESVLDIIPPNWKEFIKANI